MKKRSPKKLTLDNRKLQLVPDDKLVDVTAARYDYLAIKKKKDAWY